MVVVLVISLRCGTYKRVIPASERDLSWGYRVCLCETISLLPLPVLMIRAANFFSAVVSGLSTSMLLETVLLRWGRDGLTWINAAKTAAGMSFVSMLGMETVQNLVDYHLTSGIVALDDPKFWMAAGASAAAGFLAPLPYNYTRLRKYGKACH